MSKRCNKEVLGKRPISEATKRELRAIKVCAKSNIALDEGRMKKERREDMGLRKRGFNNMSRDGIA